MRRRARALVWGAVVAVAITGVVTAVWFAVLRPERVAEERKEAGAEPQSELPAPTLDQPGAPPKGVAPDEHLAPPIEPAQQPEPSTPEERSVRTQGLVQVLDARIDRLRGELADAEAGGDEARAAALRVELERLRLRRTELEAAAPPRRGP